MARGAAAGAFAALVPAFGLHLALAVAASFLLRGARAAAIAACLLIGNPLTHAAILPLCYAVGRVLLPDPPTPRENWLPGWVTAALPVAEEALAGGAALGALAAGPVFLVVRAALHARAAALRAAALRASDGAEGLDKPGAGG